MLMAFVSCLVYVVHPLLFLMNLMNICCFDYAYPMTNDDGLLVG